jgi:acylglycerol lipase
MIEKTLLIGNQGRFKSAGGADIYHQCWLPDGRPKAALLIVHGLAEHSGRYENIVNHFVPRGYAVYGLDHLGHGRSDGRRVYVDRFHDFLDPIKTYCDIIRKRQPDIPMYLVGHSLGGLIGAAYLLEHPHGFCGAILSGPAVKIPENTALITILAGKLLSVLIPRFGLLQLEADGVCRDPAVVEAYKEDPLVHSGKVTARLASEMLKTMRYVTAKAAGIELPVLIVHGGEDRIVDPDSAQMLYDGIGSEDKTLKIYEGLYHEVFNEPEREHVLGDVEEWLEDRIEEDRA